MASTRNPGGTASTLSATINPANTSALTASDYRVQGLCCRNKVKDEFAFL